MPSEKAVVLASSVPSNLLAGSALASLPAELRELHRDPTLEALAEKTRELLSPSQWFHPFQVAVPSGRSGNWTVSILAQSELRAIASIGRGRGEVPVGTYRMLRNFGRTIMSDVPDEIADHLLAIERAHGHVLVAGLGLGMMLQALMRHPRVERITLVEQSPSVVRLVWPTYEFQPEASKVTLYVEDIHKFDLGGDVADCVWLDIWAKLSSDNLASMDSLRRRFPARDWTWCWAEEICLAMKELGERHAGGPACAALSEWVRKTHAAVDRVKRREGVWAELLPGGKHE